MPKEIIDATINEKLVIFAGAGISTESRTVIPITFFEEICQELKIIPQTTKFSFSKIMTNYVKKWNRKKLIGKIFERLNFVRSFPELYQNATQFHRELSTLFQIKNIFTTNWDTYFEDECGAIPFVTSDDFVFWDFPERKVFKIHGSILNVGSIVATESDYKKCYEKLKKELIGNYLKLTLSTQTIVFCGYSLQDNDLQQILTILQQELRDFSPKFYLVTINKKIDKKMLKKYNVTPIFTDATFFIHSIKKKLIRQKLLLNDDNLGKTTMKEIQRSFIHDKIFDEYLSVTYPSSLYTLAYQDGLKHSFERIIERYKTGEYSNPKNLEEWISGYNSSLSQLYIKNEYLDAAYTEGYLNGLIFLKLKENNRLKFPLYYLYKQLLCVNYDQFLEILKTDKYYHEKSFKYAKELVKKRQLGVNGVNFHHLPFL